ncbi:hypothetical protein Forpi1262_v009369 [Fusarium oxysporum f. sp. raphani]|uniref:Uncharacterized protein n=1 Tax=Fusarium oxysporum f. sp. raphani TaxID=96318 RepID=A0A8J5U5Q8_FUSOX|nr:hypothetical protein Forpi1262_v009369 [Fusarium oxysporum f. sp. raphani]
MPGSTGKPLRKVARRRRQAPPTRSEHATHKQRGHRLQLENERCWVGTLKNSSRSSSSGDPGGNQKKLCTLEIPGFLHQLDHIKN